MSEMVQMQFPFAVKEVEIDGIEMGVLNDGTPYLSQRGLARMCGVDRKVISSLTDNWLEEQAKPRGRKILMSLQAVGYSGQQLYIPTRGVTARTFAYSDVVCMAILEYYAFDSSQGNNSIALDNFRRLARASFRDFIYKQVGYIPASSSSFINLEQRLILNAMLPAGYWSILIESADLMLQLSRVGLEPNPYTVPDISIGRAWASHWRTNGLASQYGESIQHEHRYPDDYPQSAANITAAIYPNAALPEFRSWMQSSYIPINLRPYLMRKAQAGYFIAENIPIMIEAVTRPSLE